jgi:hypothetical protein
MADDSKPSILVHRDEKRPERYRWIILKDGVEHARSLTTYSTRREAEAKAAIILTKQIAAWRALRML